MTVDKKEVWVQKTKQDKEITGRPQYCAGYIELLASVLYKLHIYSDTDIAEIVAYLDDKYNWCEAVMMIPLSNPTKVVEDFLTESIETFLKTKIKNSITKAISN